MPLVEYEFHKMLNETSFFETSFYNSLYNPLYKYTMELLFDRHKVPDKYIITENRVLHQFPLLYYKIAARGDTHLIKKMLKLNRKSSYDNNAIRAMRGAAEVGDIKFLRWAIQNGYQLDKTVAIFAAEGGKLEILEWIDDNFNCVTLKALCNAALKGHLEILKFFVVKKNVGTAAALKEISYFAAEGGHLEIVKFLYLISKKTLQTVPSGAMINGHLEILKFAHKHKQYPGNDYLCTDIRIYKWLNRKGCLEYNIISIEYVAIKGNLECLQFVHFIGFDILTTLVSTHAVKSGNIEMIKWLIDIRCPFDPDVTMYVFKSAKKFPSAKSLEIFKLLVEYGCEVADDICVAAASAGDFIALKALHSCGHKLNEDVISQAAHEGHLAMIIWARSQGCKWDEKACQFAAMWNHMDVLKWLRGIDRNIYVVEHNETEICPWTEDICVGAINQKQIDVLKFAIDNSCDFGHRSMQAARECSDINIVKCVMSHFGNMFLLSVQ